MNRRHDIDALRVLAFGLLIFYHVGMLYVADWDFHLKSDHAARWLQYPMLFLNRWRMELLFMISGLAVTFMRRRDGRLGLAWKRSTRLLLPLAFGMAVVIPVQPYVEGLSRHLVEPGFGRFLLRYWALGPWPDGAFTGSRYGITWNHLWYLPYLWLFTMLLVALLPALESRIGRHLRERCRRLRGVSLLVHPVLPLFACGALLSWRYPETHALIGDWYALALYGTMFLYGWILGTDAGLWAELARLRWATLLLAPVLFAGYLLASGAGQVPGMLLATILLRDAYLWIAICAVLGWGHACLNRPFRWLPYAREAVYPWYILHQSVLLAIAWYVLPLDLGPVAEPALVLAGTIGGCALLHACLIRRMRWLRPLFGLHAAPDVPAFTARSMASRG